MKIGIVASYSEDTWTSHHGYINAFESLDHEIKIYSLYKKEVLNELLDDKDSLDLIIIFAHGQLYDSRLRYTNFKCPVFAEMGDDPQQFSNNIRCAELYEILLTPDYRSYYDYIHAGWEKVLWWTHCYDENKFYPLKIRKYNYDVVTGMNTYGRRMEYIKLLDEGTNFNFNNTISEDVNDYRLQLYNGKIVFNCSNYNEITRRIFEALACQQFVLTDYISERTGLYQMFSTGVHFDTYKNKDELLQKIDYYLKNDTIRKQIAMAGHKAVQQHSSLNRVKELLSFYKGV